MNILHCLKQHEEASHGMCFVQFILYTVYNYRCVQYMLSMMCKCVMVKVGGNQKNEK